MSYIESYIREAGSGARLTAFQTRYSQGSIKALRVFSNLFVRYQKEKSKTYDFSDYSRIKRENIRRMGDTYAVDLLQQKTGTRVLIPAKPELFALLQKHHFDLPQIKTEIFVHTR